jgi:long-chain fatty acid transport protein
MWLGLSLNSPFGLSVDFPISWAGAQYAAGSTYLKTYNATPSFAYKLNDLISVGVGVQIQYAKADLSHCVFAPCPAGPLAELSGNDWAYGFTAGVTVTPTPTTTLGVGYRSGMNQKIDGTLVVTPPGAAFPVNTTLDLPGTVSAGLRQRFSSQWTGLATVEWTNWSRIGTSVVNGAPVPTSIAFQYQDGWLFSLGAEYAWDPKLTLRGGIGYEKSPITDDVRIPLLPDNDRYWVSLGGTYKWSPKLSFDLAYSHLFVKDTPINVVAGNPSFTGVPYVGTVDSHIDIISVAMKYRWDDPAPPVKQGYFKAK